MATSAALKLNCLWPLIRGGKGWMRGGIPERYAAAIRNFVRTPIGSYPWNPKYGTSIYRIRTQGGPYDEAQGLVEAELRIGFSLWIPEVVLIEAPVGVVPAKQKLIVNVVWAIPSASGSQQQYAVGPVKTGVLV